MDSTLLAQLRAPFPPDDVQFKIQTNPRDDDKESFALVVAYVDARAVASRLNEVAGLDWGTTYRPSATGKGVECILRVGTTERADVGNESNTEADKGAYSDAFKRAAVHFGVAAYLYDFPKVKAKAERYGGGKAWYLTRESQAELKQLVAAIHSGAAQLPRFQYLKVTGYQPLKCFAPASATNTAPDNLPAKGPRRMSPAQEAQIVTLYQQVFGLAAAESALAKAQEHFSQRFGRGWEHATFDDGRQIIAGLQAKLKQQQSAAPALEAA